MTEKEEIVRKGHFDIFLRQNVPHILEMIFLSLDFDSLKKCFEVNNDWNVLLTSESFQSKAKSVFHKKILEDEIRFMHASLDGCIKEVRKLLSIGLVDVNCGAANSGWATPPPLLAASLKGHKEVVKLLLDNGADPDKADRDNWTSLHWAAYYKHEDVVKLLLDRGAQPNRSTGSGSTPLHKATRNGSTGMTKCLLDNGAESDKTDSSGMTPLHNAARCGKEDMVQLLLDRGADPSKKDIWRKTPLDYVCCHHVASKLRKAMAL